MRSGFFLSASLLLLLVSSSALSAAQKDKNTKEESVQLEPVIVTASRMAQPASKVTVPYSVISSREIEARKAPEIVEYLRNVPGVTVNSSGQRGRQSDVLIRGANANHTLTLVDGVRVNSPTTGQFNFSSLTADNIERIEIIRGPQSALYGSDAIGGIVNIITKQGQGDPKFTANFEYGTHLTFNESATFSGASEKVRLSGSVARVDTAGRSLDDEFDSTDASSRLGVDLTDWLDWDNTFHYSKSYTEIDDGAFRVDPNRFTRNKDLTVGSKLHTVVGDAWDHSLQYSVYHNYQLSVDPPDPKTTQATSRFKLDSNVYGLDYQNSLPLWDFMTLTSGVDYKYEVSNNKTFKRRQRTTGYYVQDQFTLWDRVDLQTGVRLEDNTEFGTSANPHVSGAYKIEETDSKIKAGFGTGFRTPTFNQLFFPNFGNPALQPEESVNYDLGWEQGISKNGKLELNLFHSSIENLIFSTPVAGQPGVSLAQNIGKAKIDGVETQTSWSFGKFLNFSLYYDLLFTEDKDRLGKELTRRPKHAGGMTAELHFWKAWTAYINFVAVGARKDRTGLAGRPAIEVNPAYEKLDMTLSYDWNKWFQIYGRVENATSRFYSPVLGFPADGTMFFVGAKVNWEIQSQLLKRR